MPIIDMNTLRENAEMAELKLKLTYFIEFEQVTEIADYAYNWASQTTFSNRMVVKAALDKAYDLGAQGHDFEAIFKGVKNFLEVESAYAKILEAMGLYRP
jgi:hypothetical protein